MPKKADSCLSSSTIPLTLRNIIYMCKAIHLCHLTIETLERFYLLIQLENNYYLDNWVPIFNNAYWTSKRYRKMLQRIRRQWSQFRSGWDSFSTECKEVTLHPFKWEFLCYYDENTILKGHVKVWKSSFKAEITLILQPTSTSNMNIIYLAF